MDFNNRLYGYSFLKLIKMTSFLLFNILWHAQIQIQVWKGQRPLLRYHNNKRILGNVSDCTFQMFSSKNIVYIASVICFQVVKTPFNVEIIEQ